MTQTPKFALAYTRTAKADVGQPSESIIRQKEAIYNYAQERGAPFPLLDNASPPLL